MVNDPTTITIHSEGVGGEARRLRRERRTVRAMVEIYCRQHHGDLVPCTACEELLTYADRRLELCPYGSDKPTCANCPIHCYRPDPRQRMRDVMRYAGPRMLTRHPCLAIRHMIDGRRPEPPLPRRASPDAAETRDSGGRPNAGRPLAGDLQAAVPGTVLPTNRLNPPGGTRNGTAPPEE